MNTSIWSNLPKEKKQRIVLVGIVCLGMTVGITEQIALPQWQARAAARDKAAELSDKIAEAEKQARVAAANESFRNQVRQFVETQHANMICGDPFAWVVREITLLAENHPVQIMSLRPGAKGAVAARPRYATYITRLEVAGTYDQLGMFIQALENRFPTADVRSLTVIGREDGRHTAQLDLRLLIQPEKPAKKAEASVS